HHPHRALHSFPTRRSSDLDRLRVHLIGEAQPWPDVIADRRTYLLAGRKDDVGVMRDASNPTGNAWIGKCRGAGRDGGRGDDVPLDRKSTRLNSSHLVISYA